MENVRSKDKPEVENDAESVTVPLRKKNSEEKAGMSKFEFLGGEILVIKINKVSKKCSCILKSKRRRLHRTCHFLCPADEDKDSERISQTREGTQAAIQRRKKPKRRSTGRVQVNMDVSTPGGFGCFGPHFSFGPFAGMQKIFFAPGDQLEFSYL